MKYFFKSIKRVFIGCLLLVLASVLSLGQLLFPLPAAATVPTLVTGDVVSTAFKAKDEILQGLKTAVLTAAGTAVSHVLKKLTYESAVWLASGGKGQTPFADTKTFTNYLGDVLNDAGGRAIEELGRPGGFNLCKIPDVKTDLAMRVGLRLSFNPTPADVSKKPSCTFTDFQKNWSAESWKSKYGDAFSAGSIEKQFNASLDVDQTGLGIALTGAQRISAEIGKAVGGATGERIASQGFNAKLSKVSNNVQIPAQVIGEEFKKNTPGEESKKNQDQIEAAITSGDFKALPKALITFFANTLAGNVIKNFQEKGVLPFGIGCVGGVGGEDCKRTNFTGSYEDSGVFSSRQAAQELFNEYLAVQTNSVDEYNILSQINSCPDAPNLYNCRADDKLVQAVQSSDAGDPLTIQEAISKGLLHPDWQLIPPSRIAENTSKNCYNSMYCYSNIKVLRQIRLLPVGFEVAALNSDPDKPWTLGEVVKGFNNCDYQNGVLTYDPINHPFCHLIDPNWVLKVSPTRCNAVVFGSTPLNQDIPDRIEECADLSSCVGYNKDGTCISYGYCTREKNTWRIDGDKCDAQFRTCRSFTDSTGVTKAYVYRSLDTGSCTEKNSGCLPYSLSLDAAGKWQTPAVPTLATNYINQSVYFNNQVSTACSAVSAGCSAFKLASSGSASKNTILYLRQAPPYLKCYDTNPATTAIEWPKSRADLLRLQANPQCAEYAGVCIPDEVNCNWYTPILGGGTRIPGRFEPATVENNQIVWNDQCDASCVGYASFRELPSNYSVGQNLAYIIPKSGRTCQASEEGCASFTNLSTTSNGVESVEYFSYLRTCALPNASNDKNFITYEGATVGGYQIKTFTLVKDSAGGPRYWYRTPADLQQYETLCTESLYKQGLSDPDCRQFNDDQGQIYYRLLSKVIPVSESCAPYRLNTTELVSAPNLDQASCQQQKGLWSNNSCSLCLQGGEFKDGSCFYYGLPGTANNTAGNSRTCNAQADTCRAYKGNTGNNIRQVLNENFEGSNNAQLLSGWSPAGQVTISGESTHVGEHSLGYSGAGAVTKNVVLTPGKSYDLTFWAKGGGQSVTPAIVNTDGSFSKDFATISAGDTWNMYHLGPIEVKGASANMQLVFRNIAAGKLYLDNIRLVEITDYTFLVKKSLSVSTLCDSDPTDNLPGEALGCSEYKDPTNKSFYLSSFSYLCREGAIGCSAVFDTRNTPVDVGPRAYNIWLSGAGGTAAQAKVGGDSYSCQVTVGNTGCYVNIFGHEVGEIISAVGAGAIAKSTTIIPSDTPADSPVYLVADQASSCNVADLGCVYAGKPVASPLGPAFVTTTIKNDPALYENILCQSEAVGCTTYGDSNGGQIYFKDPSLIEQKICVYKNDVVINGAKVGGWFWKGVGVCSDKKDQKCQQSGDCSNGATCINVGTQPCYPEYFQEGGTYGLWSYGDKGKYNNFVGECPVEQDRCTEFVDRNDNNKAYYYKKNEKITAGDCDGQVSQSQGCALFDQTDNPNHFFLTQESYKVSENNSYQKVKPVVAADPGDNDANIIIKVERDRECGEWLQCRSSHRVWDEKKGRWKEVCDNLGRCNQTPESGSQGNITNCANWVENDGTNEFSTQTLDPQRYIDRDISWRGMDFDGYSILGLLPVEESVQVNLSDNPAIPNWRLAKAIPCGGVNCGPSGDSSDTACIAKPGDVSCGRDKTGTCINGQCVKNLDGTVINKGGKAVTDFYSNKTPSQTCRAYPEKDSPFPNLAQINGKASSNQFGGVNYCNETKDFSTNLNEAFACDCDYTKAVYADLPVKYWNYDKPNSIVPIPGNTSKGEQLPPGICQGGGKDAKGDQVEGKQCLDDDDCAGVKLTGTCQRLTREARLLGWKGFCLEDDLSRTINGDARRHPCLTWLPIDFLAGTKDVNNQYEDAGYKPPPIAGVGQYYCMSANGAGYAGAGQVASEKNDLANHYYDVRKSNVDGKGKENGNPLWFTNFDDQSADIFGPHAGEEFARRRFSGEFEKLYDYTTKQDVLINQRMIEKIIFKVQNLDDDNEEDVRAGTILEVWPNAPLSIDRSGVQASYVVETTKNWGPGIVVTGKYLGRKNELIIFYASKVGGGDNDRRVIEASGELNSTLLNGNIFRENGIRYAGSVASEGIWQTGIVDFNKKVCHNDGNWHAVRIVFKENGDFDHYDVAYCDNSGQDGQVKYDVTFKLRQICEYIADAKYVPGDETPNRTIPWTNRLWKQSGYTLRSSNFSAGRELNFGYDQTVSVFGSMLLQVFDLSDRDTKSNPLVMTTPFWKKGPDDCTDQNGAMPTNVKSCHFSDSVVKPGSSRSDSQFKTPYDRQTSGSPYHCSGPCVNVAGDEKGSESNSNTWNNYAGSGVQFLGEIFARVKGYAYIDPLAGGYKSTLSEGQGDQRVVVKDQTVINNDRTANSAQTPCNLGLDKNCDSSTSAAKGPMVFPLKDACISDSQCVEDNMEVGITINGQSRRSVRMFTPTGKVSLRFFAYADSEHMPLRNIRVDWGDSSAIFDSHGLYRNQRGLLPATCNSSSRRCEVLENIDQSCAADVHCRPWGGKCNLATNRCQVKRVTDANTSCVTDEDCKSVPTCFAENASETKKLGFGHIEGKTCENSYFEFNHTYRCTEKSKDGKQSSVFRTPAECPGAGANGNAQYPNGCCMFLPKVQVKDNWGWCSGTCTSVYRDGSQGCYDGSWKTGKDTDNECLSDKAWVNFGTQKTPNYVVLPVSK